MNQYIGKQEKIELKEVFFIRYFIFLFSRAKDYATVKIINQNTHILK